MAGEGDKPGADVALVATAPSPPSTPGHEVTVVAPLPLETVASGAPPLVGDGGRDLPLVDEDRYARGAEVGRGGLGRVLRGRDQVLDRPVALKELFATDDGSRRRFIREAMITARLQHPSIVPVYDAGRRADRAPFYAMKLVAGQPLDKAIAIATTPAKRLALLPTVLAVADAVAYAHSERIIHRDLKPANVLVGEYGETIVIDWGLAKDLAIEDREALDAGPYRNDSPEHTVQGAVLGTPGYMAPEQAAGEEVDERADVYALGAILYHVISGAIPHEGTTVEEVIRRVVAGDVVPIAEREPATPADLAAIVDKAMASDVAHRYPTARELAEDLRRFQTGQLVGAHRYTLGQRVRRWLRRHRAISVVTAVAVLVLAIFGTWSIRRILAETDEAIRNANRAVLTQARAALDRDPPLALAWLAQLDVDGPGWDAARTIAADALAQPQVERILQGATNVTVSADGRYAVHLEGTRLWIADLTAAGAPVVVRLPLEPTAAPSLMICDDGRRALVRAGDEEQGEVFTIDLVAGRFTTTTLGEGEWLAQQEACGARFGLSTKGSSYRGLGLRWRDPATQTDRVLYPYATSGAWLTADGAHVVAVDWGGSLHRYDLVTGEVELLAAVPRHDDSAGARASMSRDGEVVVAIIADEATYCDFEARMCVPIGGPVGRGTSFVVSPDGAWARGTAGDQGWLLRREMPLLQRGDVERGDLSTSPDGAWLFALHEGRLTIEDVAARSRVVLRGHDKVTAVQPLPDGRLVTADRDGQVRVWSLGEPARRLGTVNVHGLRVSANHRWLALDAVDTLVRRELRTATEDSIAWDRDSVSFAIGNAGHVARATKDARVWTWDRGGAWRPLGTHRDGVVLAVAVADDGTVVSSSGSTLAIWGPGGPRYVVIPDGAKASRHAPRLEIDDRGRHARVPCGDRPCIVDLAAGRVLVRGLHGRSVMSRDGRVAITAGEGHAHFVWDLAGPRLRRRLQAVDVDTGVLGISRDGRRAVIRSATGIDVVDLEDNATTRLRSRAPLAPRWVVFADDGRSFIDDTSTLWDVASGEGRRLVRGGVAGSFALLGDVVLIASPAAISTRRDDLPRDPGALAARLRALPYRLDEHDELVVGPR